MTKRAAEPTRRGTVGRSIARVDGDDKARGAAVYPQDLEYPPGCLHATTVRAPVARARIRNVDIAGALNTPGVIRVLTAADVRGSNHFGLIETDQPVLSSGAIHGASDVVALVIGTTDEAARAGSRRVLLDLLTEVPLLDPEQACNEDAVHVHPEREVSGRHPNIVADRTIHRGDPESVLAEAAVVVSGEYRTERVEHAFMAPEAGLAECDSKGRLTLHVATQWPEADLRQAAAALAEPIENLRLVQRTIGGAFGGREDISLQILLLLATRETGKPVRMVWDREESIRGHGKRHPFRIRHRLAADGRGRFTGASIDILVDAGCYASTSAVVLENAMSQACGPYAIDDVLIAGRAVYTNNPYTCAMRGFGVNQMTFAMEQQVNKLATQLGLDPATVRRRNFVTSGGRLASGSRVLACDGLTKTLTSARRRARRHPLPVASDSWRYGRGLASALKNVGYSFGFDDHATATVTVTKNDATVRIGAAEVGQGVATILTQIAADSLALSPHHVHLDWQDTATAPEAGSSSASRQTFVSGNAVRRACESARLAIDERGGLDALPDCGLSRTFTFHAPRTGTLDSTHPSRHAYAYTWAACVVDLRVDIDCGRVEVLRVISALDAGRVINPQLFEGQVEGGAVMGQGYALQERCVVREGMPVSLSLEHCGVPTAIDAVPEIETVAVQSEDPGGPFGARGVGEITMISIVPAITAAIHAATGVWMDLIPVLPQRLLAAIQSRADGPTNG